jgi:internalin A
MTYQAALQKIEQARAEQWEELDLSGMGLTEVPPEIGGLGELRRLILGKWDGKEEIGIGNELTALPPEICRLQQIEELDLRGNYITSIPDSISQLINLRSLSFHANRINILPNAISQLVNLEILNLADNQITVIPDSISQLVNLKKLYLKRNPVEVISDSILQLFNLQVLGLGGNQISIIPDLIANLVNLQELYIWQNSINIIPDSIAKLVNLKTLGLGGNRISTIPDSIAKLVNLQNIDLSDNQISLIPEAIISLDQLTVLSLQGNPLCIPIETIRQGWGDKKYEPGNPKAVLDYYFTTRDPNQTQTLYEAKLLLVGEGGAGKTSLVRKLLDSDYQLPPETQDTSTQGIEILDWEFTGTNGQPYKIHIWDFGGQEIYHQTHQFFLTERACYLLVADDRKENTDHYFWLQSIQLLGKNSPVHLIQNEKGDRTCNLNPNQLRGEFPNLRDTHRTNLNNNRGLVQLKTALQQELERLIPQGIPFPNKWLAVRYTLENDSRNHIDLPEYEAICQRHEIGDRSEMQSLSRFLHDLGIVLHFQTDQILKHRLILKPNWGTTAVYKILDNPTVKTHLGQFSDSDLGLIWSDPQYADMRHELLQLMKEFKVCYEIPRRPGQYIAPHLLSSDKPTYPPLTDNPLILRYKYKTFMPKGLLTRFIVEMHRDIENGSNPANAAVWKTGVILSKGPTRAEIIEHYIPREIHIRVTGPRPRDLLTIINHKFEEIHDIFYGDSLLDTPPPFDTLIPCNCKDCKPSPTPFLFGLDRLYTCLDKNRYTIECHESGDDIQVRSLIDGVIEPQPDDPEGEGFRNRDRSRRRYIKRASSPVLNVTINNQQASTMTTESSKTNNFNGPMSGVIGSDHAQVSDNTFSQVNNTSTEDLLKLITALRQSAASFPSNTREEIETDLEDLEAEITKPPADRNLTRIKKRLIAIFTAATLLASGVSGATDFTNTAIDLGQKFDIDIPALVGH